MNGFQAGEAGFDEVDSLRKMRVISHLRNDEV